MIECIEVGKTYKSKSDRKFKVLYIARHAQDCSHSMVVYTNLEPTIDAPINTIWVLSETIFIKRFWELD